MDQENDDQEQRCKRHVEERGEDRAAEKASSLCQIAEQPRCVGRAGLQGRPHQTLAGIDLEPRAHPLHHDLAHRLHDAQDGQSGDRDQGQVEQGREARRLQDAVVDLQHVDRQDECQQIEDERQQPDQNQAGGLRTTEDVPKNHGLSDVLWEYWVRRPVRRPCDAARAFTAEQSASENGFRSPRRRRRARRRRPQYHTGSVDRLCRSGMFFRRSSFGMRRLTSNLPFSTRLM